MTRAKRPCTYLALSALAVGLSATAAAQSSNDEADDEPSCRSPYDQTPREPGPYYRPYTGPTRCNDCEMDVHCCTHRLRCPRGVRVTEHLNLILVNVGATFAGRIELEYERALPTRWVSLFGAFYGVAYESVGNSRLSGFGGLAGARAYFIGRAPEGLWFAWQAGGFRRNVPSDRRIALRGLQTGGMFGWTGVFGHFAMTLGAGAVYTWGRVQVQSQRVYDGEWNPWLKAGVGAAF